jgi:hypothetical protein
MPSIARSHVAVLGFILGVIGSVAAQRGGGPSEEILKRSGSYFVDVKLPAAEEKKPIALETCSHVKAAAEAGNLSLLYVCDPNHDVVKHEQFEQAVFGHVEVNVALRRFLCARVDLGQDEAAKSALGDKAPLFVVFDAKGAKVGELSLHDYKTKTQPIMRLLDSAASRHGKLSLDAFVKRYRDFLRDYQVYEGRKRTLDERRRRAANDPAAKSKLEGEAKELDKAREDLLATEKQILELAKVPERAAGAKRLGERPRGGG